MYIENINLRRFFTKLQKDVVPSLERPVLTEEKQASLGLTALFLISYAGMPASEAKIFVVDDGEDFGIDGFFFNNFTQTLYIVQSKFRINQTKTISQGEILKFKSGVEKFLQGKIEGANARFKFAYEHISTALNDINTRIHLCVICTSTKEMESNVFGIIEEYCASQNVVDSIFSFGYFKFDQLYQMARFFTSDNANNVEVKLYSYGSVTEPYKAYYGYVDGVEVASWVKKYGASLFEQNVRFTLQGTDVNEGILDTIQHEPEKFWYFNNGITAIAAEAVAVPSDTNPKTIKTKSMSIVNGAQTAGMLSRAADESLDLSKVKVQFRVISLSDAGPGFDENVTRANNTQNELNPLDFVSLDPRQDLLRNELAGLGYDYVFKRGYESSGDKPVIEVKDAAVALACADSDISISVQAKRYVSGLWSNIKGPPYTKVFREGLSGQRLLAVWTVYKTCDRVIKQVKQGLAREEALILTHGDKFITHCVFKIIDRDSLDLNDEEKISKICGVVSELLPKVFSSESTSYPATAFKNQRVQEIFLRSILATI
ncbi:AIPR family protein [Ciceribacter azotifigens]|uniref:AIPR family protein n=1 Tax=Ciceribacter azotifigens TaxID=2069303 RepID=UPI003A8A3696